MAFVPAFTPMDDDALAALDDVMAFIDELDGTSYVDASEGDSDASGSFLRFLDDPSAALATDDSAPVATTTPTTHAPAATNTTQPLDNSGASAATTPAPVKEPVRKRNAHREKMKREMQYLRLRAAEMEQQLVALRQGTARTLSMADQQLIDASWQRIAGHQREARRESEAENARLKDVLQTHVQLAKSLRHALGERTMTATTTLLVDESVRPKVKRGRNALCDEDTVFAELFGSLDAAFDRFDEVMASSGLASVTSDRSRSCESKTHTSVDGVTTIPYIELTDTIVGPFPTRLVAKAGWEVILQDFFQRSSGTLGPDNVWYTGTTVAARMRTKHTLEKRNSEVVEYLNAKIVVRKYVDEENRLVLVWRGFNQLDDSPDMYSDETGWTVMQSYASTGSLVRTCVHFVQRHRETASVLDPTAQQLPAVGVLTDLVTKCNEEDMTELLRAAENLLLSETSGGKSSRAASAV